MKASNLWKVLKTIEDIYGEDVDVVFEEQPGSNVEINRVIMEDGKEGCLVILSSECSEAEEIQA